MPRTTTRLIALAAFSLAASLAVRAAAEELNWPQWRGPQMTGASPTANPPLTWSESSNIKWKVKIPGRGLATPLVWGNQVFIQTAIPTTKKDAPAEKPDDSSAKKDTAADRKDAPREAKKDDADKPDSP